MTLQNVSSTPVIGVTAILDLGSNSGPNGGSYAFSFNVSPSAPLLPNQSVNQSHIFIGGGFSGTTKYPVRVSGTFQNGVTFDYIQPAQVVSPSPTSSTSTPTPTNFSGEESTTYLSNSGLALSLSLSATEIQPGQQVSLTIAEKNTLNSMNTVQAANNWPLKGLGVSACGTLNYPIGIAIFQGYYTSADINPGALLALYDPYAPYACPMILSGITAYAFKPLSAVADVLVSGSSEPAIAALQMNAVVAAKGYWTAGQTSTFANFAPGVYTVVGGDEWGGLVVLHFTVSG